MNDVDQRIAKKFDPETWVPEGFQDYVYAGTNLIQEVNDLDPEIVIDAGCGYNRFKGHIQNLIGFDLFEFPNVDIPLGFDDVEFRKECADVVLALGSIQFSDKKRVERHLAKVVSWVKPGGYIIMKTMGFHEATEDKNSFVSNAMYLWSEEDRNYFTNKFNLEIVKGPFEEQVLNDDDSLKSTRHIWWWQKPGERKKYAIEPFSCEVYEVTDE
jgi:SAM-dependent methyltransferase